MRSIILIAALAVGPAVADTMVARGSNGASLTLYDEPCADRGVLEMLRKEWRPKFRRAEARVSGSESAACWIVDAQGDVFVAFPDGAEITLPIGVFKRKPGV